MRRVACLVLGLVLGGTGAAAHHAIASVYDTDRSLRVEGALTIVRFVDPHPTAAIEVVREGGSEMWQLEFDNRRELTRAGMSADTLQTGDRVVVSGSPARIAPRTLYVGRLDRPADGFWYELVGRSPRVGGLD